MQPSLFGSHCLIPDSLHDQACFFAAQIRANAPDADVIVIGFPEAVLSGYKTAAAQRAFYGNVTVAIGDLKDAGFGRLHYLTVPPSVKTVRFMHSLTCYGRNLLAYVSCSSIALTSPTGHAMLVTCNSLTNVFNHRPALAET